MTGFSVRITVVTVLLASVLAACSDHKAGQQTGGLLLHVRHKAADSSDSTRFVASEEVANWDATKTAIIVTDMWDRHWCRGATARVGELAPFMNKVIAAARDKGVLIIYAPSDCVNYYKDYPARKAALKYHDSTAADTDGSVKLPQEENKAWPVDQSNEGCNDTPRCVPGNVWTKQISALQITDKDIISDSGAEIEKVLSAKGIDNIMMMGVHTNMCIIHRSFGLRNLVRYGKKTVLVRDLTDAMYDSRQSPYVNHFNGVGLVINYIEKYISPTILSTDITGAAPFHFASDPAGVATR